MESSPQKVDRLIGALEFLSDQELCLLNSGDHGGAIAILNRSQPVIDEISRLMTEPSLAQRIESGTRARVDRWLKDQGVQLERLAAEKSATHQEIQALQAAHTRTQLFRSAYGHPDAGPVQSNHYAGTG